jgi:hypothetical protein
LAAQKGPDRQQPAEPATASPVPAPPEGRPDAGAKKGKSAVRPPRRSKTATTGGQGKKKAKPRSRARKKPAPTRRTVLLALAETACLAVTAVTIIMVLLGLAAERFSGTRFLASLLPFALGVLGLVVVASLSLFAWLRLRRWLLGRSPWLPASLALACLIGVGVLVVQGQFYWAFGHFRTLVGGRAEAGRVTLTHQVFAAYRRLDPAQLQTLITRAQVYTRDIDQAAAAFGLDPDLLHGVAATESSFLPRTSSDGGQGLFQITRVPDEVTLLAGRQLGAAPRVDNHRDNAFLAAATLRHYLQQMQNDLFLGLLAYNIGPKNGGLRFIMRQYGAMDFVTIQPYLQQLPRDYPIRVLSHALAFRLLRREGRLLSDEEGLNAVRIQQLGVPGL